MREFFGVNLEFNHIELENVVRKTALNGKGYCCFVDLTSLVYSYEHDYFKSILNSSTVNSCDGSYIAIVASRIYGESLKQYIGPDFFNKVIFDKGVHVVMGSTITVYNNVIKRVEAEGGNIENINYVNLPFKPVHEFDYKSISQAVNKIKPNYIWVSLGAPKQEIFMNKLLPYIDRGILLGVGAALNYFSGEIRDIPNWVKKNYLVWVYRLITEPRKQIKRLKTIFLIFPKMIKEERLIARK